LVSAAPLPENGRGRKRAVHRLIVEKVLAAASSGTLVVSRLSVVLPPNAHRTPPSGLAPGDIVSDEFASMALLTPAVAMLNEPVPVIGPPVNPAPLPTLVTVPVPTLAQAQVVPFVLQHLIRTASLQTDGVRAAQGHGPWDSQPARRAGIQRQVRVLQHLSSLPHWQC